MVDSRKLLTENDSLPKSPPRYQVGKANGRIPGNPTRITYARNPISAGGKSRISPSQPCLDGSRLGDAFIPWPNSRQTDHPDRYLSLVLGAVVDIRLPIVPADAASFDRPPMGPRAWRVEETVQRRKLGEHYQNATNGLME